MMHHECVKFFEEVISAYWPDYEPDGNGKVFGLWKRVLLPYSWNIAEQAAEELKLHKFVGKVPDPGKFREIARRIKGNTSKEETTEESNQPTVFVMCVEQGGTTLPGTFFNVHVLGDANNMDYVVACATAQAARYASLYGGKWDVIQNTTFAEMSQLRRDKRVGLPPSSHKGNLGAAFVR